MQTYYKEKIFSSIIMDIEENILFLPYINYIINYDKEVKLFSIIKELTLYDLLYNNKKVSYKLNINNDIEFLFDKNNLNLINVYLPSYTRRIFSLSKETDKKLTTKYNYYIALIEDITKISFEDFINGK